MAVRRFIPELESARGVAAIIVVGYHVAMAPATVGGVATPLIYGDAYEAPIWNALRAAYRFIASGYGDPATPPVLFFYVLSGFVLARSLQDRPFDAATVGTFIVARILRLYPAVVGSVLIFCGLYAATGLYISWPETYRPLEVLRTMMLLSTGMSAGVLWSVQVEVLAIPLLILVFASWAFFRKSGLAILTALTTGLVFWPRWREFGGPPPKLFWAYAFCFGAMAAYLPAKFTRVRPATIAVTAAVVLIAVPGLRVGSNIFRALVDGAAAAALVAALATGQGGGLARVLNGSIFRFYGRISFSLYLLHPLVLTVLWNVPDPLGLGLKAGVPSPILALLLWAASLVVITPLAWLSYEWIERPGIALGRRICAKLQASPEPRAN